MPTIRTASDLQRNISEIYELCENSPEPVYITRNGKADLVVMNARSYEIHEQLRREVFDYEMTLKERLMAAYEDVKAGRVVPLEEALERMGWDD
ncbi:MAG: type II toxin-antitoxin system Phd/YefM family antitoxin [Eggerthellaceae bacterium]|nr:type II toxin-antitoxin system Phd/YefM family antitoxin [Eggerthellaceae bacterium]